jgi:hypothetical protein
MAVDPGVVAIAAVAVTLVLGLVAPAIALYESNSIKQPLQRVSF